MDQTSNDARADSGQVEPAPDLDALMRAAQASVRDARQQCQAARHAIVRAEWRIAASTDTLGNYITLKPSG